MESEVALGAWRMRADIKNWGKFETQFGREIHAGNDNKDGTFFKVAD